MFMSKSKKGAKPGVVINCLVCPLWRGNLAFPLTLGIVGFRFLVCGNREALKRASSPWPSPPRRRRGRRTRVGRFCVIGDAGLRLR